MLAGSDTVSAVAAVSDGRLETELGTLDVLLDRLLAVCAYAAAGTSMAETKASFTKAEGRAEKARDMAVVGVTKGSWKCTTLGPPPQRL